MPFAFADRVHVLSTATRHRVLWTNNRSALDFHSVFDRLENILPPHTNHLTPAKPTETRIAISYSCFDSVIVRWQWNKSLWHETIASKIWYLLSTATNRTHATWNCVNTNTRTQYSIRPKSTWAISNCIVNGSNMLSSIFTLPKSISKHISSGVYLHNGKCTWNLCWQKLKSKQSSSPDCCHHVIKYCIAIVWWKQKLNVS